MDNENELPELTRCFSLHVIYCGISSCLGIIAAATFLLYYHLPEPAAWAFLSAVFAAVCLHLHKLYRRNVLAIWHTNDTLQGIYLLGLIVLLIGSAFGIWYLFVGLYYHKDITSTKDNPYISSVWAFMTAKWGMFVMLTSRKYTTFLSSYNTLTT